MSTQLELFPPFADWIESRVAEILASRRKYNASGQNGEDAQFIRAELAKATPQGAADHGR